VILPDHLPKPSGGIYSYFFQQNTLSTTLVSKMAAKTQCNVIGLSCIRNTDAASFDVYCTELTQDMYNMTAHVKIDKKSLENYEQLLHEINHELKDKYKIVHTTFQFEWE
jgi:KDO2-lipid IV(A) lauroyltransferase